MIRISFTPSSLLTTVNSPMFSNALSSLIYAVDHLAPCALSKLSFKHLGGTKLQTQHQHPSLYYPLLGFKTLPNAFLGQHPWIINSGFTSSITKSSLNVKDTSLINVRTTLHESFSTNHISCVVGCTTTPVSTCCRICVFLDIQH